MPRPGPPMEYVKLVHHLAADGMKPSAISREIADRARREGWADAPQLRTVQRLYARWLEFPEEERRLQGRVHWPEAMLLGLLPWEAAPIVLDLLRWRDGLGRGRPSVRLARWFWRVSLAAPDLSLGERACLAGELADAEYIRQTERGEVSSPEGYEWYLAYHPWRGADDQAAYHAAKTRERRPVPDLGQEIATDLDTLTGLVGDEYGDEQAERMREQITRKIAEAKRGETNAEVGRND